MTETQAVRPLIVVGVDGSAQGAKAVSWAVEQARLTGGTVELLTAWALPVSYGLPIVVTGVDVEADAREVLAKAAADIDLPADRVRTTLLKGAAPTVLVEHSRDADLLVVGSHGHNEFAELLLGSVSKYCVHHANCPVVVVR